MTLMNIRSTSIEEAKDVVQPDPAPVTVPSMLFEMMRSFVTLAHTLNLSHAVKELDSTRQTVRRHIATLEEMSKDKLFLVEDRKYVLTQHGAEMLPEAQELVARGKLWVTGKTRYINDLLGFSHEAPNGWSFYQQQQPLTHVWDRQSKLLAKSISAWSESHGQLEHPGFQALRPFVLVYRDTPHGWLSVEIGEKSFYSSWWGWTNARSSIGRNLGSFPGGPEFESLLNQPFNEVRADGGLRLDEVVTQIPRVPDGPPIPLAYLRLCMGGQFPDGSFALIVVVDRSEKIRIDGLNQSVLEQMPADARAAF